MASILKTGMSGSDIREAIGSALAEQHSRKAFDQCSRRMDAIYELPTAVLIHTYELLLDRDFAWIYAPRLIGIYNSRIGPIDLSGKVTKESVGSFLRVEEKLLNEPDVVRGVIMMAALIGSAEQATIIEDNAAVIAGYMKDRELAPQRVLEMLPLLNDAKPLVDGAL